MGSPLADGRKGLHRLTEGVGLAALGLLLAVGASTPAWASPTEVSTETGLRRAWQNPRTRAISVERDIFLRACQHGSPIRE